ncbi:MAG: hypothetical protein ACI8WL_001070 [Polaribacter sp.]|jgi:hypothetical protein|tara:strand:+ start:752 stop:1351 length:600 start_codon:yes stop_codon:yes gene_type:complete
MTAIIKISNVTQALILAIVLWSFYAVMLLDDPSVYAENNLLESTQALTLALALVFFLVPVFDSVRNDRLIAVFMSLLSLGFILRELDVEQFDLPNILILLGSGKGRNLLLGTGLLLTLATALFKFRYYLSLSRCFFRHGAGIATLFAGLFLVIGDMFEKIDIPYHVLYEESLELVGYAILLLAASKLARREVKSDTFIR